MKRSLKRLIALVLALSMTLSLLSTTAWATDTETIDETTTEIVADDGEIVLDLTEDADDGGTSVEEAPADEESSAEEATEEVPAEEVTEETSVMEAATDEVTEETAEEEASAEELPAEDESKKPGGEAVMAVSAESTTASGTCGDNLTWTLSSDGVLTISGSGKMEAWTSSSAVSWASYKSSITAVVLESGVTSIGNYAFYNCESLTSVSMPDTVTSIGACAFCNCYALPEITFGSGLKYLNVMAFSNCVSLTTVEIPASVVTVDYLVFFGCTDLTAITVDDASNFYCSVDGVLMSADQTRLCIYPGGKTGAYRIPNTVTSIDSYAFAKSNGLTSVTVPSSVTSLSSDTFFDCLNLTSITLPDGLTTLADAAIFCCSRVTSLTVPKSVTIIGEIALGYTTSTYSFRVTFYTTGSVYSLGTTRSSVTAVSGFTISGYTGSAAETYASDNSFTFKSVGSAYTDISACTVTLSATSYTYDGTAKQPTVTVKDGSTTLTSGTDYTVAYSDNTNAGTATVTVTGVGNYTGTVSKTFTIAKADMTVSSADYSGTYNGSSHTFTLTVSGPSSYTVYYSTSTQLTSNNYTSGTTTKPTRTSAGITTVYYYIKDNTGNYSGASGSATITISKATITASKSNYTGTYDGSSHTFTLAVSGPSSYTIYYSTSTSLTSSNYSTSGTTTKPTRTNAGTTTVYYYIKDNTGNYSDASGSATITINKASQALTASAAATSIYAGKTTTITARTTSNGAISYTSSDTSIATVSNAGKVTGKKPGTVKITVKVASTTNYNAASKTISITVKLNKTTISSLTNTASGITVKWSKVTGASGYYIYRDDKQVKKITSGSTVSYTDTGAKTNGAKYQYKIYAYYGSTKSAVSETKTRYFVSTPTISSASNSASKAITVKWKKNSKASGYQLYISTSSDFSSGTKKANTTAVRYKITGLTKGKTYYVKVRAYKTVSGTKYYSAWSSSKKVKVSK